MLRIWGGKSAFLVGWGESGGGVTDLLLLVRAGEGVLGAVEVKYAGSSPSESESGSYTVVMSAMRTGSQRPFGWGWGSGRVNGSDKYAGQHVHPRSKGS